MAVRGVAWLVMLTLLLLTLAFALLTLGSFASLGSDSPLWLRSLGSVEAASYAQLGFGHLPGFTRALILTLLTSVLAGLTAYVKPRK